MSDEELLKAVLDLIAGIGDEHDMVARREIAEEIIILCLREITPRPASGE